VYNWEFKMAGEAGMMSSEKDVPPAIDENGNDTAVPFVEKVKL
jgi:hypothetical protein